MKNSKRILSLLLSAMLATVALTGCTGGGSTTDTSVDSTASSSGVSAEGSQATATPNTDKEVNLVMYFYGPNDGVAIPDLELEINRKLKEDINATIEFKGIEWADVATKYPLLFMSGEKFDMSYGSLISAAPYDVLASQDVLMDISGIIDTASPVLKETINEDAWKSVTINNKIYAVPNNFTELLPYGFATRRDLMDKYGIASINSIEDVEAYMAKVVENETFAPINGNTENGLHLYRTFLGMVPGWVEAPGIPNNQLFLVSTDVNNPTEIIHPAFTQEFEDWAVRMNDWNTKGYFAKDMLSSKTGAKDNFNNGISGLFIGHMMEWSGNYGGLREVMPDVETEFWTPLEDNNKLMITPYANNLTLITNNAQDPERALMAIEKFMTDESYYRLIQNGQEGRQYKIEDGVVKRADSYAKEKDEIGYGAWALRNDLLNLPLDTEDPRRISIIEDWKTKAIPNPYLGVNIDDSAYKSELSSIANVDSQIGIQILLGKTQEDPKEAVAKYREQLLQAGVEATIASIKEQVAEQIQE